MRNVIAAALAAVFMSAVPVLADDADGTIAAVDLDSMKITLDDGETYKLPGEIDTSAIKEGIEVFIVYQTVDGEKLITDMELVE